MVTIGIAFLFETLEEPPVESGSAPSQV